MTIVNFVTFIYTRIEASYDTLIITNKFCLIETFECKKF